MNSQFESRIRKLEDNEYPVLEKGCWTQNRTVSISDANRNRSLTELYWKDGVITTCTLDGTVVQSMYTTRTSDRSSGARNIRSPRFQGNIGINVIPTYGLFTPQFNRSATPSSGGEDYHILQSIQDPSIQLDGFDIERVDSWISRANTIIKENVTSDMFVCNGLSAPNRMTQQYVNQGMTYELSFDLKRVYVFAKDLINMYYSGITLSSAISAFAMDVASKLNIPFTNVYPLVKQWLLDSEHPILSMKRGEEFTLYMIPRTFSVEKLETLKHIILQRFDVLEVSLTKRR